MKRWHAPETRVYPLWFSTEEAIGFTREHRPHPEHTLKPGPSEDYTDPKEPLIYEEVLR